MRLTASARTEHNWDEAKKRATRAQLAAAKRGGEELLEQANKSVPLDEGDLRDSGYVEIDKDGNATIAYSAEYAVRQHEDTGLEHQGSGRAKWLQLTADERAGEVGDAMADEFEKEF